MGEWFGMVGGWVLPPLPGEPKMLPPTNSVAFVSLDPSFIVFGDGLNAYTSHPRTP